MKNKRQKSKKANGRHAAQQEKDDLFKRVSVTHFHAALDFSKRSQNVSLAMAF